MTCLQKEMQDKADPRTALKVLPADAGLARVEAVTSLK